MDEKKYSLYDSVKKFWFKIDRIVHDMDIVTTVEPVSNHNVATVFPSEESANRMIKQIDKEGNYDVSNCEIKDINKYEEELKKQQEQKEKEMFKAAWENTDEDEKKKIITQAVKSGNCDSLTKFLNRIGVNIGDIDTNEDNKD